MEGMTWRIYGMGRGTRGSEGKNRGEEGMGWGESEKDIGKEE